MSSTRANVEMSSTRANVEMSNVTANVEMSSTRTNVEPLKCLASPPIHHQTQTYPHILQTHAPQ